jgi:A/G-specific adenine glycosylase
VTPTEVQRLLRWHREHVRVFPWRSSREPYRLAVTELMLVRTQAAQVARLWNDFFERFPTVAMLANAGPVIVADALRPLGLTWRASRIHSFAVQASTAPNWIEHPEQMPGGGPYVVAALRMGVRGRGSLPVDITIARVLARYYGLDPQGEARRDRRVLDRAASLGTRSRRFFHALLDLAALVCVAANPRCSLCPLSEGCVTGRVTIIRSRGMSGDRSGSRTMQAR